MLDYTHGESRLLVERGGETLLFYGSHPSYQKIKDGIIDIDELYRQLEERLNSNASSENWSDSTSTSGMVTIQYKDKTEKDFLIFDEEEFAESLLGRARNNIVDSRG